MPALPRFNDVSYTWVMMDTWTFATRFSLPGPGPYGAVQFSADRGCGLDLVLDGVDTVAEVRLDGHSLARLQNFHRSYRLDVRHLLTDQPRLPVNATTSPANAPNGNATGAPSGNATGTHLLEIEIFPAVPYIRQQVAAYPYPVPTNRLASVLGDFAFIRKPGSDMGWDWGPAFAPAGLHGAVRLVSYCAPYVAGLHVVKQRHNATSDGGVRLLLEAEVWTPPDFSPDPAVQIAADLRGPGGTPLLTATPAPLTLAAGRGANASQGGTHFVNLQIDIAPSAVQLWWPVGFGPQPLYTLSAWAQPANSSAAEQRGEAAEAEVRGNSSTSSSGGSGGTLTWRPLAGAGPELPVRRRVGLRTVELVTVPLEQAWDELSDRRGAPPGPPRPFPAAPNETFYFRVNGQPVYARGANLIPLAVLHVDRDWSDPDPDSGFDPLSDANPDPAGPPAIARVLAAALGAGMNMIRVWGGGRYQLDELYDMADGAGLLVWQEFMFACNPYPNSAAFRAEVAAEVATQVRRLAGHPSIVVWGGNNEVESSFTELIKAHEAIYAADFMQLFVGLIREQLLQLDPGRPYLDTSPSKGVWSTEPYIKRWGDPTDPAAGDVHFYNYKSDCLDPVMYPRARFVSEYGYQSFASYSTVRPYGEPADWSPQSDFMRHRQHHAKGEAELNASLASHFRHPPGGWGDAAAFQAWIYQTQVQQALCYSAAIGLWRSLRSDPAVLNMGVLYWQLNDIWPGYSWSSLDFGGGRKPLHSALQRALAPLALAARLDPTRSNVTVYFINDGPTSIPAMLTLTVVSLVAAAPQPQAQAASRSVAAAPQRSTLALSAPAPQLLQALPGCTPTTCLLLAQLAWGDAAGPAQLAQPGNGNNGSSSADAPPQQATGPETGPETGLETGLETAPGLAGWPWGGGRGPAADEARLLALSRWARAADNATALAGNSSSTAAAGANQTKPGTDEALGPASPPSGGVTDALVLLVPPKELLLSPPDIEVYNISYGNASCGGNTSSGNTSSDSGGVLPGGGCGRWCFRLRARAAAAVLVTLESDAAGDFDRHLIWVLPRAASESVCFHPRPWPLPYSTAPLADAAAFLKALHVRELYGMQAF